MCLVHQINTKLDGLPFMIYALISVKYNGNFNESEDEG